MIGLLNFATDSHAKIQLSIKHFTVKLLHSEGNTG